MKILISILALLLLSFITYIIFNMRRGHRIAVHLYSFGGVYDSILSQTTSKELALESALAQFKTCPRFCHLTDEDIQFIVSILAPLPDPKKIIEKVVLQMDSKKAVKALKDRTFLEEIAKIYNNSEAKTSGDEIKLESLKEKAENLVDACRTLLGIQQPTLYRSYPELLTLSDDTKVTFFGTIAFVCTACVSLHFDVAEKDRTSLELIVQNQLREWHPDAIDEYENIYNFISKQLLKETDRAKRGALLFDLAGIWAVARITNEEAVKGKSVEIAKTLSNLFLQETSGYWK